MAEERLKEMAQILIAELQENETMIYQKIRRLIDSSLKNITEISSFSEPVTQIGNITFYPQQYRIAVHGTLADLLPSEFHLLHLLAVYAGNPVGHQEISQTISSKRNRKTSDAVIAANGVMRLRKKLQQYQLARYIHIGVVMGVGYRLMQGTE